MEIKCNDGTVIRISESRVKGGILLGEHTGIRISKDGKQILTINVNTEWNPQDDTEQGNTTSVKGDSRIRIDAINKDTKNEVLMDKVI